MGTSDDEEDWTYLEPGPEHVTINAFGHDFVDYPSGLAEDLITLEKEGAIYSHFAIPGTTQPDGTAEFAYYRIHLLPAEVYQYVEASLAYQEYNAARARGASFEEALDQLDDPEIAERVRRYGDYGRSPLKDGTELDLRGCHASFYPPGMEALLCGRRPDRYESLPEFGAERDRFALVMQILNNFPTCARVLTDRQRRRTPYAIETEYDVQDLLFAQIRAVFDDARREEWTPQQAGSAKRIDIVIPSVDAVVETKYVRSARHATTVADELRVDFESYHYHPSCAQLIALVHDPAGHLPDPQQFSNDLSGLRQKDEHSFEVTVLVR